VPRTLLLADNSVTIQRVIALVFADEDIRVVSVDDGEKAIAAIDADPPDLVLADLDVPGRSGLELARYIRGTPRLSHIPVLLLAGAFEPVDPDEAAAAGCAGVLTKPVDPQQLIARVRALIDRGSDAVSPPPVPAAVPPVSPVSAPVDEYLAELDAALTAASRVERSPAPLAAPEEPPVERVEEAGWPRKSSAPPLRVPAQSEGAAAMSTGPASLADAFTALLRAERSTAPAPAAPNEASAPELETIVELATRRVLERLSDRVVRDMAPDIITRVAERMVREEIQRIRDDTT
jgi:CheY-like chemotaxis protein